MSETHPNEGLLNEVADGTLAAGEVDARAHVEACVQCSARVRELRDLLESARRLAEPVHPERDLWAGIQARMRAGSREIPFPGRSVDPPAREAWPPALRAAAAIALLLAGAAAGMLIARSPQEGAAPAASTAVGADAVLVADDGLPDLRREVGGEYEDPLAELAAELDRRRGQLPPEVIEEIERNLAIVDGAIDAARAAFDESPDDPVLPRMLRSAYGRKVELLEQAIGLPRTI
ncbi:MAG TPA: hypothetical protein VML95_12750 [Longimicrobiales bacterium]|nr:hypothetical protein [Longimicrobiales bacterium]